MRQLSLDLPSNTARNKGIEPGTNGRQENGKQNKLRPEDMAAHDWYRFVLSFPPHLVRDYIERFGLNSSHRVLDPFCGTGTTLVECKKQGIPSIGIEPNPMACFATQVKVDWSINPDRLVKHAREVAAAASSILSSEGFGNAEGFLPLPGRADFLLRTLPPEKLKLLLKDSISPLPLHKSLVLLELLARRDTDSDLFSGHERLALAKTLVFEISNLRFGPEVGVKAPKHDAPVIQKWLDGIQSIAGDLRILGWQANADVVAKVCRADSRSLRDVLEPKSVDAVITSPPYPNEKDYTRTTRLESVLLGFIEKKTDIQDLKRNLVRSNTRSVYKADRDDTFVSENLEIQSIAKMIEARRIELGKTSGFERLYGRLTKLYFGGMARHLADLRDILRPGAQLAYVVGDQASYLRVMIRTGRLLGQIAESLGYELIGIDLFRTRVSTATGCSLREEVVILRWPGKA